MHLEQRPRVVFTKLAYKTMLEYCKQSPGEITGFGSVQQHGSTLYVDEVYITPQEVTGGHCEITGKTLLEFMTWCNKNKRKDLPPKARLWWHSHNNFGCFRSGTDKATVEMLLGGLPYLLCIVANKKGEMEVSLHFREPRVTILNVKVEVVSETDHLEAEIKAEVEQKVSHKTFTSVVSTPLNMLPSRTPAANDTGTTQVKLYTDDELAALGKALKAREPEDRECDWCHRKVPIDRLRLYPASNWCGEMNCHASDQTNTFHATQAEDYVDLGGM